MLERELKLTHDAQKYHYDVEQWNYLGKIPIILIPIAESVPKNENAKFLNFKEGFGCHGLRLTYVLRGDFKSQSGG